MAATHFEVPSCQSTFWSNLMVDGGYGGKIMTMVVIMVIDGKKQTEMQIGPYVTMRIDSRMMMTLLTLMTSMINEMVMMM